MITIVDYGVGNIKSFVNVYNRLNIPVKIAKTSSDLEDAHRLILPGVGHFDHAMSELIKSGMREKLDELVLVKKIPVIGICVGMQMMGNSSEEGSLEGIKWIDASIKKLDETKINQITRLPHMGWNNIQITPNSKLLNGIDNDSHFYFVHSFAFDVNEKMHVSATTNYSTEIVSAIEKDNIFGTQFHPEKSQANGIKILENFVRI